MNTCGGGGNIYREVLTPEAEDRLADVTETSHGVIKTIIMMTYPVLFVCLLQHRLVSPTVRNTKPQKDLCSWLEEI